MRNSATSQQNLSTVEITPPYTEIMVGKKIKIDPLRDMALSCGVSAYMRRVFSYFIPDLEDGVESAML